MALLMVIAAYLIASIHQSNMLRHATNVLIPYHALLVTILRNQITEVEKLMRMQNIIMVFLLAQEAGTGQQFASKIYYGLKTNVKI